MAMKSCYHLSQPVILQYYNLLGIDSGMISFDYLPEEESEMESFAPYNDFYYLPQSSQRISTEWLSILQKTCVDFGDSLESDVLKQQYMESILGILNVATSLNLVEEGNEDYQLHFERLNSVLYAILREINTMFASEVCSFYQNIQQSNSKELIHKYIKRCPYLTSLSYLAMNDNCEIEDYQMFENETSFQINLSKLLKLVSDNAHDNHNYKYLKRAFYRVSYIASKELTEKR